MAYTRLKGTQKLIAQHTLNLSNGEKLIVELIENSPSSVILSHIKLDRSGAVTRTNCCGYCGGVLVGCVDCPNNDPFLDCVNNSISCQS